MPGCGPINLSGIAIGPDASIYVVDSSDSRLRRIQPAWPGFAETTVAVPSDDASEIYIFDEQGRHLCLPAESARLRSLSLCGPQFPSWFVLSACSSRAPPRS